MSSVTAPQPVTAGRAMFDGWRHATLILPALLVLSFLTMFNPYVLGVAFLAMLVGAAMLRPMSFARLGGLLAGLATGLFLAYAGLWAVFQNLDI